MWERVMTAVVKKVHIALDTIAKVNSFVHDMDSVEGEAAICSGRYYVDAKSAMGIFTLDLSKTLELRIGDWKEEYAALLQKYMPAPD